MCSSDLEFFERLLRYIDRHELSERSNDEIRRHAHIYTIPLVLAPAQLFLCAGRFDRFYNLAIKENGLRLPVRIIFLLQTCT